MKHVFLIILTLLFTLSVFAQAPEKLTYQAIVRDSGNNLVPNQSIGMQIKILQGAMNGTVVYEEIHSTTANANGLVTVEMGSGAVVSGNFATINWANGPYFIESSTDPTGGTNYTITGTSELLSVPYALYAKSAENVITENDPVFGSSIASGITAADTINWNNKLSFEVDGSVTNEIQNLILRGDTLSLTNDTSEIDLGYYITDFKEGGESRNADRRLGNKDNHALGFITNDTTRVQISENGNVGVGTSNPSAGLEVSGNTGSILITSTSPDIARVVIIPYEKLGIYAGEIKIEVAATGWKSVTYDIKIVGEDAGAHYAGFFYQNGSISGHLNSVAMKTGNIGSMNLTSVGQQAFTFSFPLLAGGITHPLIVVEIATGGLYNIVPNDVSITVN